MNKVILILILFIHEMLTYSSNPCPQYFRYVLNVRKKYGIISIPGPSKGKTILEVKIAITNGRVYDDNSGQLNLVKDLNTAVNDGERGKDIEFRLDFPETEKLPILTKIILNYKDVCVNPNKYSVEWTYIRKLYNPEGATKLSIIPPRSPNLSTDTRPRTRISSYNNTTTFRASSNTCGIRFQQQSRFQSTHLIMGGETISPGEFPWMAAIFHLIHDELQYKCGGTLISDRHILTAAHCEPTIYKSSMQIHLGRHDLENPQENYVKRSPLLFASHLGFIMGQPNHDIAIIFIESVKFTENIKSICLWKWGTRFDENFQQGTITGWGQNEHDGYYNNIPRQLKIRKVEESVCKKSNPELNKIVTENTFCAGGQRVGPCHGDSGSGFYHVVDGVWYLRGIVSTALGNNYMCFTDEYSVYVDIAQYLHWLQLILT